MSLQIFVEEYAVQLSLAVATHPQEYGFSVDRVPGVVEKMRVAFERGSYNKDGRAIKATCKKLGVPYTYAGINAFVRQNSR